MISIQGSRVLVAPLDWGLGHAARCVPVIKRLLLNNKDVVIGADNEPLAFLRQEFPDLEWVKIPGYPVHYPSRSGMALKMLIQLPALRNSIASENRWLQDYQKKSGIETVISDNRYGLHHPKLESVIISHQIQIQAPLFGEAISRQIHVFLGRFGEVWIPDDEGKDNLSGRLSRPIPKGLSARWIGPLSRFSRTMPTPSRADFVFGILSGPEPRRSQFEQEVIRLIKASGKRGIIVRGKPSENRSETNGNIKIHSHLPSLEFQNLAETAAYVICSSGYSTIMDMSVLGTPVVLIPTPGQTEQEYLAKRHSGADRFSPRLIQIPAASSTNLRA